MRTIRSERDIEEGLVWLLRADPRLEAVARAAGPLPLRLAEPGFEGLTKIVVSQMISRASADAIWARLHARLGGEVTAETYLACDPELRLATGLSRAKEDTLRRLAEASASGALRLDGHGEGDSDELLRSLTAIRGVGPWTAEVYLMFCAGHPDIFPAGDVALRIAVSRAFASTERLKPAAVLAQAQLWAPWRSVAARLFWAYYAATIRSGGLPVAGLPPE